nr:hypothetical protein [uncultured archaeon]
MRVFALFIFFILLFGCASQQSSESKTEQSAEPKEVPKPETENGKIEEVISMKLTSPAFKHGENIPRKYTCDGEDINPPLKISDVPTKTQSLVLIVDDPDAPMGTFVHWVAFLDVNKNEVPESANLQSGQNDFGRSGYGGPCPPSGQHTYRFKLYALDIGMPSFVTRPTKADIEYVMKDHIIAQAELDGEYKRG